MYVGHTNKLNPRTITFK